METAPACPFETRCATIALVQHWYDTRRIQMPTGTVSTRAYAAAYDAALNTPGLPLPGTCTPADVCPRTESTDPHRHRQLFS